MSNPAREQVGAPDSGRPEINLRTTFRAAIAQIRQLNNLWNQPTADMVVIGLKVFCALCLINDPDYLYSTMRLQTLSEVFPASWWLGVFAGLGVWMSIGLLFGTDSCPGGVANPYLSTPRQIRFWQYYRMLGWFAGTCFNVLVVILLAKHGFWSFGVGLFLMKSFCCIHAFSSPFRMRLAEWYDARHQRWLRQRVRSNRRALTGNTVLAARENHAQQKTQTTSRRS